MDLIYIQPVYHNKIWGGRDLQTLFGLNIPDGKVGECWAISAHENGDCIVSDGVYAGKTLSWLWANHRELFGGLKGDRFPLLIKLLDASDDLSIQVHPDDAYAAEHEGGSLGKRECWYVVSAKPGATIIVGQRAHDREEFERLVAQGAWDKLLNEIPVHAGDFFQIDPGCVHAIKGGTVLLETQQSSDVTYRVYDYDRRDDSGELRELHLDKALDVIDYAAQAPHDGALDAPVANQPCVLEQNESYTVVRLMVEGAYTLEQTHPFMCVSVVEGQGTIEGEPYRAGQHVLVPSGLDSVRFEGELTVVCSWV